MFVRQPRVVLALARFAEPAVDARQRRVRERKLRILGDGALEQSLFLEQPVEHTALAGDPVERAVYREQSLQGTTRRQHLVEWSALGEQPLERTVLVEDPVERPVGSEQPVESTARGECPTKRAVRSHRVGQAPQRRARPGALGEGPVQPVGVPLLPDHGHQPLGVPAGAPHRPVDRHQLTERQGHPRRGEADAHGQGHHIQERHGT